MAVPPLVAIPDMPPVGTALMVPKRPWPVRVPLEIDPVHESAHICHDGAAVCVAPQHLNRAIILHEAGHLSCRAKGGPGHLYPPGWSATYHDVTGEDYYGIGTDMLAEGCAEAEKQRMEGLPVEGAPMKSFKSPTAMLQWQYREMLAELGELQRHAADPTCPCVQADTGEYCLMKHALGIAYLARETASMVPESDRDQLETLAEEALELHVALKDRVVCGKPHKDEADAVEWARQWRKRLEPRYYQACGTKKAREAGLLDSYLSGQSFGAPVQYEAEGADEPVEGSPPLPACIAPRPLSFGCRAPQS